MDHPVKQRSLRRRRFRKIRVDGRRRLGGDRVSSRNEFYALDTELVVKHLSECAEDRSKHQPSECTTSSA